MLLNYDQSRLFINGSIAFRCGCADWRELPLIVSSLQYWHKYEPALAKSHSWLCRAYSTRHSRSGELIVYWLIFCYSKSVSNLTLGWPETRHGGEGVRVDRGFTVRGVPGQSMAHFHFVLCNWTNQRPECEESDISLCIYSNRSLKTLCNLALFCGCRLVRHAVSQNCTETSKSEDLDSPRLHFPTQQWQCSLPLLLDRCLCYFTGARVEARTT